MAGSASLINSFKEGIILGLPLPRVFGRKNDRFERMCTSLALFCMRPTNDVLILPSIIIDSALQQAIRSIMQDSADSADRFCLTKFKVAPGADVQANQLR